LVQGSGPIPPGLIQHFNAILRQARALAEDPNSVKGQISPEAIQLALRLRERDLKEVFQNVPDLSSLTPEKAGEILSTLGASVET
jgi:hypothetical protein